MKIADDGEEVIPGRRVGKGLPLEALGVRLEEAGRGVDVEIREEGVAVAAAARRRTPRRQAP